MTIPARILWAVLCGSLCTCLTLAAAEQRQFAQDFETTASQEAVAWSTGDVVDVIISGDDAYVLHTLKSGTSTMVKVPLSVLDAVTATPTEKPTGSQSNETALPAKTTEASPPETYVPNTLELMDGTTLAGKIIRIEPRFVVLQDSEETVHDIPFTALTEDSAKTIKNGDYEPLPDPRIKPGAMIWLEVPDIGASNQTDPARFSIRIPENYDPDAPSPLILWLAGGKGSDNCNGAKSFIDPADYILVAFPYPAAHPSPVKAISSGNMDKILDFQKPMLERLQALVPNTHPQHRVAVGFSNGAHTIASAVCDDWEEFHEYFTGFVMHEGGNSETKDHKDFRKKDVLVGMGGDSPYRGFSESVVRWLEDDRVKPDVFVSEGEKHNVGANTKSHIKEWIAERRAEVQ